MWTNRRSIAKSVKHLPVAGAGKPNKLIRFLGASVINNNCWLKKPQPERRRQKSRMFTQWWNRGFPRSDEIVWKHRATHVIVIKLDSRLRHKIIHVDELSFQLRTHRFGCGWDVAQFRLLVLEDLLPQYVNLKQRISLVSHFIYLLQKHVSINNKCLLSDPFVVELGKRK